MYDRCSNQPGVSNPGTGASLAQQLDLASKFPRFQSSRATVGRAGQTSPTHGGPASQLPGLKGSAANILVPDTTGTPSGV